MMTDRLDAAMEAAITEKRIVGGVLLVCERGETVYARAIGLSDRASGRVMEVTDRFRLASVTKPIATACFMSLVEDGTLSLSDPVTAYLPDFRPRLPDGTAPEITLHHLITHTSGLGYRFLEPETGPYAQAGV
ncbi:MAG: serine hydrolase domain-containing protein, partial [Pseudooceanicola nanhaiensis]|uniref:serine hydrolase domain-containing protein n=1 Tax=Pseudooceanicola nanhaiensis TaxID=375761 RepID=UPI004057D3F6